MRSRNAWLALVWGLVVVCGVACGQLARDDDGVKPVAGGGAGGHAGRVGGGGSSPSNHAGAGAVHVAGGPTSGGEGGLLDADPSDCAACAGAADQFAAGAGGASDDGTPGECSSGKGCVVAQGSEIRDLTADSSDLYWVEHGSFDELGNYDNDGRLMKRDFASGSSTELAKDLAGPVSVALTTTHVFMYLDQVWEGNLRFSLARMPLAGGPAQVVELDALPNGPGLEPCLHCLVHAGDTLYFPLPTGLYKLAAQDAEPSLFSPLRASSLAIAGDYLYLVTRAGDAIWRVPLAGGEATQLSADPRQNIQVWGDYVYSHDTRSSSSYLTRMPVAGGPWVRLPKAQSGFAEQLQITGDSFFYRLGSETEQAFVVGSLGDPAAAFVSLALPRNVAKAWIGTTQGLFWTGGQVIRQRLNIAD